VLPMNEFLIYIRKHFVVFSRLSFHVNIDVLCSSCDVSYVYMIYIYIYWMHS
jgi:hypothetical protein